MASNFSGQKTGKKLIAELESQIRALQIENQRLRRQALDTKSGADARKKYWRELQYRSWQRRRNKQTLISAFYWVQIARYVTIILALILGSYVGIPTVTSQNVFDGFPKEFRYYLGWKINDKWCSLITGLVGFLIAIPAQRTFPAPVRVFSGTMLFAIKQILDIFLLIYVTILLPPFGLFVLYLLNKDRLRQVSNQS